MTGFDKGRVFSAQVLGGTEESRAPEAPAQTENNLYDFLQRFRNDDGFIYRDRLRANLLAKQNVIEVVLEHLELWNPAIAQALRETPGEMLPLVSCIDMSNCAIALTSTFLLRSQSLSPLPGESPPASFSPSLSEERGTPLLMCKSRSAPSRQH